MPSTWFVPFQITISNEKRVISRLCIDLVTLTLMFGSSITFTTVSGKIDHTMIDNWPTRLSSANDMYLKCNNWYMTPYSRHTRRWNPGESAIIFFLCNPKIMSDPWDLYCEFVCMLTAVLIVMPNGVWVGLLLLNKKTNSYYWDHQQPMCLPGYVLHNLQYIRPLSVAVLFPHARDRKSRH